MKPYIIIEVVKTYHFLFVIETNGNVTMCTTHLKSDVISLCFVSDQNVTIWTVCAILGLRITAFLVPTVLFCYLRGKWELGYIFSRIFTFYNQRTKRWFALLYRKWRRSIQELKAKSKRAFGPAICPWVSEDGLNQQELFPKHIIIFPVSCVALYDTVSWYPTGRNVFQGK